MDFGNVYGQCLELQIELPNGEKIYTFKPAIKGIYGKTIRVLTSVDLRPGVHYSISGIADSIVLNGINITVFRTKVISKIGKPEHALYTERDNDINRIRFASFFVAYDMVVKSVTPMGNNYIVELVRETLTPKHLNYLSLTGLTTSYVRGDMVNVNPDDVVTILGSLHKYDRYDSRIKRKEVGIHIFAINPDNKEIARLKKNTNILHTRRRACFDALG